MTKTPLNRPGGVRPLEAVALGKRMPLHFARFSRFSFIVYLLTVCVLELCDQLVVSGEHDATSEADAIACRQQRNETYIFADGLYL